MAVEITGQLGAADVSTLATLTDIYTVPATRGAGVTVNITNRANTVTLIQIAHIKNDVAANVSLEDYIMFDFSTADLASNRTPFNTPPLLMEAGDTIAVLTSASAVTVQVNGIEEDA